MGCYIRCKSHPNSFGDPCGALRLGFVSLFAQQNFDFAQDDRLIGCLVVCVRFREEASKLRFAPWQICFAKIAPPLPVVCLYTRICLFFGRRNKLRFASWQIRFAKIAPPLRWILLCSVGAIHESPALTNDTRSFSGRRENSRTKDYSKQNLYMSF